MLNISPRICTLTFLRRCLGLSFCQETPLSRAHPPCAPPLPPSQPGRGRKKIGQARGDIEITPRARELTTTTTITHGWPPPTQRHNPPPANNKNPLSTTLRPHPGTMLSNTPLLTASVATVGAGIAGKEKHPPHPVLPRMRMQQKSWS
jgi:hypothetical protein